MALTQVTKDLIKSIDPSQINSGGATGGEVLTYNISTSTWVPSAACNYYDSVPIGSVSWFSSSAAPIGYLECNGQIISKSQYSELWNTIGDTFSAVSLSANHFRVPDLRGEFIRGWDHSKGTDSGRVFGSWQIDEFKSHRHQLPYNPNNHEYGTGGQDSGEGLTNYDDNNLTSLTGGTETRPRNVALLPCIKAVRTVTGTTDALNFIPNPSSVSDKQVLTYDGGTSTWGASSLSSVGFDCLMAGSGYQKLPSGLIIQWKSGTNLTVGTIDVGAQTLTWPIAFPNQCLRAIGFSEYVTGSRLFASVTSKSTTQVIVQLTNVGASNGTETPMAIGIGF